MKGRRFYVYILLNLTWLSVSAQSSNELLLQKLSQTIDSTAYFDQQKINLIHSIEKRAGLITRDSLTARYNYFRELYEAYKLYKFDSAFACAKMLEETAAAMNDPFRIAQSGIDMAFILLSAGMFKEADAVMKKIVIRGQPDSLKAAYYLVHGRYYYDLADYTADDYFYPDYFKTAGSYLDSALQIFPDGSFEKSYYSGLQQIKNGDLGKSFHYLRPLIDEPGLTEHQFALAASTLSFIYSTRQQNDSAAYMHIRAAIADIRSSTKETFAILNVAQIMFREGDFKRASAYIRKAVDDAATYGSRQRKIQMSTILPIIQASELSNIRRQQQLWILYAVVVSLILILFAWLLFVIRRQNRKLRKAKQEISDAHARLHDYNEQLMVLNGELQSVNGNLRDVNFRLEESNKIKEEYVGYFFTLDAEFFQKIERIKKSIEEKIHYGKFNEIRYLLNNINIKDEKDALVKSFDKAFLKLFPNFVVEFNNLFDEESKIRLADGELLNTDLRIYALLRLGIRENEKIAEILQYSVKSIYAYKTKIRNRSRLPKDEFDRRVMEIRSVDSRV